MKNNEIETLMKRRDTLEERIKNEKLKLFENFTLEFLNYFEKDINDLPSTKKGCREFIKNLVDGGNKVVNDNGRDGLQEAQGQYYTKEETFDN